MTTTTTMLDTPFDVENEEGTPPRELLPAGKYQAEIVTAVVGPTKNGKGQAVNLTWSISEGEHENRLVFQSILIQHESVDAQRFGRQKFKDICSSCCISDAVTDLQVLLHKPCMITVGIRKDKGGQYPDKNEVSRVGPVVPGWNGMRKLLKGASSTQRGLVPVDEKVNDEIPF
jgi:hypothetical protein